MDKKTRSRKRQYLDHSKPMDKLLKKTNGRLEVALVYKKSKLDLYVNERKNPRFERLLDEGAEVVGAFEAAHQNHERSLAEVKRALDGLGVRYKCYYRARLRAESTRDRLVITVGGDGTLLDASRRVGTSPVLGVNSDPDHSIGFLCAATAESFAGVLARVLEGSLAPTPVARIAGSVDGVPLKHLILNEILISHRNPAATTRYILKARGRSEPQKSSGVWIAGPAGATAAIGSAGGVVQDLDDPRLQVLVREPYRVDGENHHLLHFFAEPGEQVRVVSKMREGMLYIDGPHQRVPFPVGAELVVSTGAEPLNLIVTPGMTERRAHLVATRGATPPPIE